MTQDRKEYMKIYNIKNKEYMKKYSRDYYIENKEHKNEENKKNYEKNKEKIKIRHKNNYLKNKEKWQFARNEYARKCRKNNPLFKIKESVSKNISYHLFKSDGIKPNAPTWSKLPYTPQQLIEHLESKFEDWMTWDNHGLYNVNKKTWQN